MDEQELLSIAQDAEAAGDIETATEAYNLLADLRGGAPQAPQQAQQQAAQKQGIIDEDRFKQALAFGWEMLRRGGPIGAISDFVMGAVGPMASEATLVAPTVSGAAGAGTAIATLDPIAGAEVARDTREQLKQGLIPDSYFGRLGAETVARSPVTQMLAGGIKGAGELQQEGIEAAGGGPGAVTAIPAIEEAALTAAPIVGPAIRMLRGARSPAVQPRPTAEPQGFAAPVQAFPEEAPTLSQAAPMQAEIESSLPKMVENIEQSQGGKKPIPTRQMAEDVQPDTATIEAAKELGIPVESIPPEVYSLNKAFRVAAGAARSSLSTAGKELKVRWDTFRDNVSIRIDKALNQWGADDIATLNKSVKERFVKDVEKAEQFESAAYDNVSKIVDDVRQKTGKPVPVDTKPVIDHLNQAIEDVGGFDNYRQKLSGGDLDLLDDFARVVDVTDEAGNVVGQRLEPIQHTWKSLETKRKQYNDARKGQGAKAANLSQSEAKRSAGVVSNAMRVNADYLGFGDDYRRAMESTGLRAQAEQAAEKVLGKQWRDRPEDFSASLRPAMAKLAKGESEDFVQLMASLPDDTARSQAVKSWLYDNMLNQKKADVRESAQFIQWFNSLSKKPKAKEQLYKHLEDNERKFLENYGKLAGRVNIAVEDFVATGRLVTDPETTGKLGALTRVVARLAAPRTAAVTESTVDALRLSSAAPKINEAAAEVIGSVEFANALSDVLAGKPSPQAIAALEKSQKWRRFIGTLDKDTRRALAQSGTANWLISLGNENDE